jgi:DNA-directed RNA polymerase I, II, and III subunit RPABC3
MADAQVFEETFSITSINNEKYDRVSRIFGTSTDSQITMSLDINHELFPVEAGQTLSLVLATTLALDGTAKGDNDSMWRSVGKQGVTTLADMYDYVCYGKNYRMEGGDGDIMCVERAHKLRAHAGLTAAQKVFCQLRRAASIHGGSS